MGLAPELGLSSGGGGGEEGGQQGGMPGMLPGAEGKLSGAGEEEDAPIPCGGGARVAGGGMQLKRKHIADIVGGSKGDSVGGDDGGNGGNGGSGSGSGNGSRIGGVDDQFPSSAQDWVNM